MDYEEKVLRIVCGLLASGHYSGIDVNGVPYLNRQPCMSRGDLQVVHHAALLLCELEADAKFFKQQKDDFKRMEATS